MRAREAGIPFEGTPGTLNAITDVAGIEVGLTTIIEGDSVRTGVTAIFPRGRADSDPVYASWFPLNGNGEMTGTTWIDESGFLEGPIMITNTHSVGVVQSAVIDWQHRNQRMFQRFSYPVVAETYDGHLNDINGFHVKAEHALSALENARGGPVPEGNVGGGTGMVSFYFKGGTGTASRVVDGGYTIGVLVQANFGRRDQLTIAGNNIGKRFPKEDPRVAPVARGEQGSIIVVVATDAPLLPHQLRRIAKRAGLGLGRTGGAAGNFSGDIMLAFSTANAKAASATPTAAVQSLSNSVITPLFDATIFATEEAILNAMASAETMTGYQGNRIEALPVERVVAILQGKE